MSYDEWIDSINILMKSNDKEIKNKLLSQDYNENIFYQLEPKLIELIKYKFNKSIEKIIASLEQILKDKIALDMLLNEFKKKVMFAYELIDIKVISEEKKNELKELFVNESNNVYDILTREVKMIDPYGIMQMTIKNNRIRWS